MGKLRYPEDQLYAFRGNISAIEALFRGAQRELKSIGVSQEVISAVEELENEALELFNKANKVTGLNLGDEVYEDMYISAVLSLHLMIQQAISIIMPSITSLDISEQSSLKRVSLLPEMQAIVAAHLRNIVSELNVRDECPDEPM